MLHGLRLINIGNHRETTLRLSPVTAILGPNGSGKTTVLNAIKLLCRPESPVGAFGISEPCSQKGHLVRGTGVEGFVVGTFAPTTNPSLSVARNLLITQSNTNNGLAAEFAITSMWALTKGESARSWLPKVDDASVWDSDDWAIDLNWPVLRIETVDRDIKDGCYSMSNRTLSQLAFAHPLVRHVYFSTRELKRPSISHDINPVMADDGSGISSVLSYLMTADRLTFTSIVEAVRKVVPTVRDIRATRCPITIHEPRSVTVNKRDVPYFEDREVIGQQLRFDMASGDDLPADRISDGTMLVLAIITLLKTMPGAVILLDDIEQGLHPSAQRQVIQLIKSIQKDHPSTQIIFTTHSPYVVDEMDPEHVWVMGLDKEGCAHSKALAEHPNATKAMEVLSTGEFWSAEGEDWVVPEGTEA
jgi:ABC-type branched-subunit amino acid transport system ATPase component